MKTERFPSAPEATSPEHETVRDKGTEMPFTSLDAFIREQDLTASQKQVLIAAAWAYHEALIHPSDDEGESLSQAYAHLADRLSHFGDESGRTDIILGEVRRVAEEDYAWINAREE